MWDWKVLARHMSYRWDSLKILSLCILLVLILQELSELRSRKWRGKAKYISSNPFLTVHQTAWWMYSVQVSSRSYLIEVGKKISNKHQCKPLNTVSQSGKIVSLLFEQEIRREWWANPDQEAAHVGNVMAQFVEARLSSRAMKAVCQLHSEWDKSFSVWSYKYKKIGKNVLNTEVSAVSDSNQW